MFNLLSNVLFLLTNKTSYGPEDVVGGDTGNLTDWGGLEEDKAPKSIELIIIFILATLAIIFLILYIIEKKSNSKK